MSMSRKPLSPVAEATGSEPLVVVTTCALLPASSSNAVCCDAEANVSVTTASAAAAAAVVVVAVAVAVAVAAAVSDVEGRTVTPVNDFKYNSKSWHD